MNIHFFHQKLGLVNGYYAVLIGLHIHKLNPKLETLKLETLQKINALPDEKIINSEINKGYSDVLLEFNSADLIPAGQNFVQMIRKQNKFPTINTAVDAYNIVAAESFLAIGAHDLDKVKGDITFDFAKKSEIIPAVNMTDVFQVNEGDYVYRDEEKILAWLDVRDTDLAKLSQETKAITLIVEGNRNTTPEYIKTALEKACGLIQEFNGGTYEIKKLV